MQSELTILDKYKDLDQPSRDLIGSLPGEDPAQTIANLNREKKALEKIKNIVSLVVIASALIYLLYSLGLPKSISGFIGGSLLFLFWGIGQSVLILICVEILFAIINKLFIEMSARHKFCALIETSWTRLTTQRKQAENDEKIKESMRLIEIDRSFHRDFDQVTAHFSTGQSLLMPASKLSHKVDDLASHAIECAVRICRRKDVKQEKKSQHVNYYRGLISLLPDIEDDRIVELEDCLRRISGMLESKLITESTKSSLLSEYTRIALDSQSDLTRSSENRVKRSVQYTENFEKAIDPLMSLTP
jgi:hypothetical protein